MDDDSDVLEAAAEAAQNGAEAAEDDAGAARQPAAPIESRFLYVDVAAQRAKQLRRGARPRLEEFAGDAEVGSSLRLRHKIERIAMREVDRGKIHYEVPDPAPASGE
jgi:DNA-directed RNA polymerase omega subunit